MDAPQVPINRWMDKVAVDVYSEMSHKREWNLDTYDNMDDPEDMIKSDREK